MSFVTDSPSWRGRFGSDYNTSVQQHPPNPNPTPAPALPRPITDDDLYGKMYDDNGNVSVMDPRSADIHQDDIGDCYLLADLGAVADQQPDQIKNAIAYDPKTHNFRVKLHRLDSGFLWIDRDIEEYTVEVTQADLADNVARKGGGLLDNYPNSTDTPAWASVMETALAKTQDSNWGDGLDEGYHNLIGTHHNHHLSWSDRYINESEIMFVVTGRREQKFHITPSPYIKPQLMAQINYERIDSALKRNAAVVVNTAPEMSEEKDGLVNNHRYIVRKLSQDSDGTMHVTLRNPWGHNRNVDGKEGSSDAEITVNLETIMKLGSIDELRIEG